MNKKTRIYVNLAAHPLRNRRLFSLLVSALGFIFLVVILLAGNIYLSYKGKGKDMAASVTKIDQSIRKSKSEERQYSTRIDKAAQEYKGMVDLINSLILRKSFSWIDFLSCLEDSLPESSYIVSLAPMLTEDLKMIVRFGVVSRNLNDLLKLINNLEALNFKQVKVLSESRGNGGSLQAEISLIYERNI